MEIRAIIGGPSYRMECDVRHAGAMVELALMLMSTGKLRDLSVIYRHGVPVEMARNAIFRHAVNETDATVMFWADSDVYWQESSNLILGADWLVENKEPCLLVPVLQRNGDSNIISNAQLERVRGRFPVGTWSGKPFVCWGGGMGLAMFNLQWYRDNWAKGPWFRTDWVNLGTGEGPVFISEDIWHTSCLQLAGKKGALCYWAPLVPTWHAARGGDDDAFATAKDE